MPELYYYVTMTLPSRDAIEQLHRKYATTDDVFEIIYTHCLIVEEIALWVAETKGLRVDKNLLSIGALLHDIGVYRFYDKQGTETPDNYLRHGIYGYEILKTEGFDEVICRFGSHHTGVGITKAEIIANKLPLPHEDFMAETDEELLVMYADKFHSKDIPPCFNTVNWYADHVAKFGDEKRRAFVAMVNRYSAPDLGALSQKYGHIVRGA